MPKKVIVIGAGFAGLSAASFMAKEGWEVTVLEKHSSPGGRARQLRDQGFVFDMGPSWYWMPEVFERYFAQFGKKRSDFYSLKRLDPSYRVYWKDNATDIPAGAPAIIDLFESIEPGAGKKLSAFLAEANVKYTIGMGKLVFKPGRSLTEFLDPGFLKGVWSLQVFTSLRKHIYRSFSHPRLRQLLEFPVLFLGALPQQMPALYSLMNYADIEGGTWYPDGGMYSIVSAMYETAKVLGVQFKFSHNVQQLLVNEKKVAFVRTDQGEWNADAVIVGADYHHAEMNWLPAELRSYTQQYWDGRVMAPSALIYYIGLNKKLKSALHHSLFFDTDFETHANEIYETPQWPSNPMFYMCVSSVTDDQVAPQGCENLFLLVPVAAGLQGDDAACRDRYLSDILTRVEARLGEPVKDHVIYQRSFSVRDFREEYNSFKGNAYGLANTLLQTAVLKPSCKSKKLDNLFYTGQLTVPGPGVPPSLISGEVVAGEVIKSFAGK